MKYTIDQKTNFLKSCGFIGSIIALYSLKNIKD